MPSGSEAGNQQPELGGSLQRTSVAFPCEAIPYLLSTGEAAIILFVGLCSCLVYHWLSDTPVPDLSAYFALGLFAGFIHIARFSGGGFYDFENAAKPGVEVVEISISWLTTALILAFFAFVLKVGGAFSRGSLLIFLFATPLALLAERKLAKLLLVRALNRGAIGRHNMVLLGTSKELDSLGDRDLLAFFGASEVNRFVLSAEVDSVVRTSDDRKTLELLTSFIRNSHANEILLALPWDDLGRIDLVRDYIKALPISARLLPDGQIRALTNYASSAQQRILSLEVQRAPLSTAEQAVKRAMDLVIGAFALVFFAPVMALTAFAIRLDGPGPVFSLQSRKGFNGRQFVMHKFRTMRVGGNGDAVDAARGEPGATRIGRLLRAASMDELPQLINVIRGEMSLVGPRPHALAHDNQFEKLLQDYAFRHHVKPGVIGWAQVNGLRGVTSSAEELARRIEMDLWYIDNWSLWFDIQILIKAFFEVVRKQNPS